MITLFENFNDRIINLKSIWETYFNHFEDLYPDVDIRNKNKDYIIDIKKILINKHIKGKTVKKQLKDYANVLKVVDYDGGILDIQFRYYKQNINKILIK